MKKISLTKKQLAVLREYLGVVAISKTADHYFEGQPVGEALALRDAFDKINKGEIK